MEHTTEHFYPFGMSRRVGAGQARYENGQQVSVFDLLKLWNRRFTERQAMKALEPHQLEDIGVTREQMLREANKPVWRR